MPWEASDAKTKTGKANTPGKQKLWEKVSNQVLAKSGDDGRAIREANAVVARMAGRYKQP